MYPTFDAFPAYDVDVREFYEDRYPDLPAHALCIALRFHQVEACAVCGGLNGRVPFCPGHPRRRPLPPLKALVLLAL